MEHWAQKCDGAACPAEYIAVCKERDELKDQLQKVTAQLHEATSERDALVEAIKHGPPDPCSLCKHNSVGLACDGEGDCDTCESKCICGACDTHASNFAFVGAARGGE